MSANSMCHWLAVTTLSRKFNRFECTRCGAKCRVLIGNGWPRKCHHPALKEDCGKITQGEPSI